MTADIAIAAALAALDQAAEAGHHGARHAAALLRGTRSVGRKPIDDERLLDEVGAIGRGRASVMIVARKYSSGSTEAESIARRLRRKIKRTK